MTRLRLLPCLVLSGLSCQLPSLRCPARGTCAPAVIEVASPSFCSASWARRLRAVGNVVDNAWIMPFGPSLVRALKPDGRRTNGAYLGQLVGPAARSSY
jgi:hypothetical protein